MTTVAAFEPPHGRAREWLLPSRDMHRELALPLAGAAYVVLVAILGGLGPQHVFLGSLGLLDLYNERSRRFLRTFLPFIATGIVFDSMRYYYWPGVEGRVHVAGPYELERAWFGIGGRTLNEIFLEHHWAVADLVAGFAYLVFVAEYVALAILLFARGLDRCASVFAKCFLVVNVMGFITYFVYPAAPPWYVTAHGLGPASSIVATSPAAGQRFDQLLGTHVFETVYGHGIDVFGAVPSLHVAYPFIAAVLAFRFRALRWARWPAAAFAVVMCFSAIYLQHHYVLDVLLGLSYGALALAAVTMWERRHGAPAW